MRRFVLLLVAALSFAASALADDANWTPEQRALAQTDKDFYAASIEKGGTAWGDFASEEARMPYGKGKGEIAKAMQNAYAQPGFSLKWDPDFAQIFGEVGVTSGRYESHKKDAAGADVAGAGRYVTVWRRQENGSWRFEWDGGSKDPGTSDSPH